MIVQITMDERRMDEKRVGTKFRLDLYAIKQLTCV
jgi:hypothetical protein